MKPLKRLGQHFLRDPNLIDRIVRSVQPPDGHQVVEIGPGRGAITGRLLDRFPDLIAIEIDERAVEELRTSLPALDVRQGDILNVDWRAIAGGRPLYVVGNLPYNITTPILFGLLDSLEPITEAVVMMQLEVARRLVASPRTKEYGILSVATQLAAEPDILFRISRHVFEPKPAVESALVRLRFHEAGSAPGDAVDVNPAHVRKVIRTAFNQRRKTLRNSLSSLIEKGVELPARWASRRAEELPPTEFVELAHFLKPV